TPPESWQWAAGLRHHDTLAEADQFVRLRVLWATFWVTLMLGTVVSLNWTSMHGFYRDRLREAYIEPQPGRGRDARLSEVDTPAEGAPYLLLSGTLNLLGDYRSTDSRWPFLFSPLFCGSDVTGYVPTDTYLGPRDRLADVAAISGAAINPAQAAG